MNGTQNILGLYFGNLLYYEICLQIIPESFTTKWIFNGESLSSSFGHSEVRLDPYSIES